MPHTRRALVRQRPSASHKRPPPVKSLHAKTGTKRTIGFQVFDHLMHCCLKLLALVWGQTREIVQKLDRPLIRWHRLIPG